MTTISKFYFHDAVTTNTGTMPSGDPVLIHNGTIDTGNAVGATTARTANDVIGTGQTSSTITSNADTNAQGWSHRRFVSAPIAAHTFTAAEGNWTFSYARSESNLNHNQIVWCGVHLWRPSTGAWVGGSVSGTAARINGTEPTSAGAQQAESVSASFSGTIAAADGDILVFEIYTVFTQVMGTSYTDTFYYDGTTEASATNCASFVTPPAPLTLYTPPVGSLLAPGSRDGRKGALPMRILRAMAVDLDRKWSKNNSGLLVPA